MNGNDVLAKAKQLYGETPGKSVIAYSGGLDSLFCAGLFTRLWGTSCLSLVLFDVGQKREEIELALRRAKDACKLEVEVIDIVPVLLERWLPMAIKANALYQGYPVAAPIIKQVIGEKLALRCDGNTRYLIEGSSGKGNDQFRMHNSVTRFSNTIEILAPVRDLNLTRTDEISLCDQWDLDYDRLVTNGGDDQTLWCHSIGSGAFGINDTAPAKIFYWYKAPSNEAYEHSPLTVTIGFEKGTPVSLNGRPADLLELTAFLNDEAGKRGIGYIDIIEDGILGIKSREIYEAPAALVLITLHKELERMCLTKRELEFKSTVDNEWVDLVYNAYAHHRLLDNLEAFITASQRYVSGKITAEICRGHITIIGRGSEYSLFSEELRCLQNESFNQRDSIGLVNFYSLPYTFFKKHE
jgi:argininosuccinate synthase